MSKTFSRFDPAQLGPLLALKDANTVVYATASSNINRTARATQGKSGYQWFAEFAVWGDDVITDAVSFGLVNASASLSTYVGGDANGVGYRVAEGQIHNNGASVQAVTAGAYKDIIGIWLDISDGTNAYVTWLLNGVPLHTYTLPNTGPWYLASSVCVPGTETLYAWINTGQRAFEFPVAGVDGWFEFADQVPTVRVAARDFILPPSDPIPNAVYEGRLEDDKIEIVQSLAFWPDGRKQTQGSAASISIANSDGALDAMLNDDYRDVPVSLEWMEPGQSILIADHVADMIIDDVQASDDGSIKVRLASGMAALDAPLQNMIFPPSADEVVAGKPWPVMLGAARSFTPTLVDPVTRLYALADQPVVGWGYIRDMGAPLDPNAGPPGYVISDDFRGIILETNPVGKLTADASSTGGGTLPSLADDIWDSYGNPFTADSAGDLVGFDQVLRAEFLQLSSSTAVEFTSGGGGGTAYIGISTATMQGGRSYRYRVIVRQIAGTNQYGQPSISIQGSTSSFPYAVFTEVGTYEGVITPPGDIVPRLVFLAYGTGYTAVVDIAYILEIPDTYTPANINAITLTDFVREIVEKRGGLTPSQWSSADTQAIDAATGYEGIGYFANEPTTVRAAIEAALSSYCACAWVDDDGVLRFTRLVKPEGETAVGEITEADMLSEPVVTIDYAPNLSTQMRYRKNWTVLSETDFVTDFITVPLAVRNALGQPYQGISVSATALSATYSTAVHNEPAEVLLDVGDDAQAEIDHVCGYYATLRKFYTFQVPASVALAIGQVWTLTYPRYGLDDGKNLMVSSISRRLGDETIKVTLRG